MGYIKEKIAGIKELIDFWPFKGWEWRIRNIVIYVDDPVDDVKHKIHGISIFGLKIYLPKWLMRNSGKDDK